jgi:catechol 2,3-dioxygenase-like lactoylglutathione lyase family enzyme
MQINHLHLHVADVARAAAFYERAFGLQPHVWHEDILFLRDEAGMDLALAPGAPDELPPWFHFGFRLESPQAVRDLFARLTSAGDDLAAPLSEAPDFVWFRCRDPDGHAIEVYWEPQRDAPNSPSGLDPTIAA